MSTTGLGAEPPRRLRGKKRRAWEARAAQEAAAEAFARMDSAQRELRARFTDPATAPAGWSELDADTEAAARRYLQTQDHHPVGENVGKPELLAAAVAFRQAAFDCARAAERLAEFARAHP
ncbi:hypothetical protein GCM10009547_27780 [Sporichthya brevicatena]|uniref:Uncharacterized protein n=1 Tax=Sporichthya brevicatena TaxID=171442 RepID=A0ABP3S5F1_9ACTN